MNQHNQTAMCKQVYVRCCSSQFSNIKLILLQQIRKSKNLQQQPHLTYNSYGALALRRMRKHHFESVHKSRDTVMPSIN